MNAGQRYELSKLIDIFLARKLAALPSASASGAVINTVNPGFCTTGFVDEIVPRVVLPLLNAIGRTAEIGARNLAWACTADTPPGAYVSVTSVRETSNYSRSEAAVRIQDQLWEELVDEWLKIEPKVKLTVG